MFCTRCRYPLVGLEYPKCPECGLPFDPADHTTYRRHRNAVGQLQIAGLVFVGAAITYTVAATVGSITTPFGVSAIVIVFAIIVAAFSTVVTSLAFLRDEEVSLRRLVAVGLFHLVIAVFVGLMACGFAGSMDA